MSRILQDSSDLGVQGAAVIRAESQQPQEPIDPTVALHFRAGVGGEVLCSAMASEPICKDICTVVFGRGAHPALPVRPPAGSSRGADLSSEQHDELSSETATVKVSRQRRTSSRVCAKITQSAAGFCRHSQGLATCRQKRAI